MDAPKYDSPPAPLTDPSIAQQATAAQADSVAAAQTTAQIDSASLMARYGTMLALHGASTGAGITPVAGALPVAAQPGMMPFFQPASTMDAAGLGQGLG